MAPPAPLACGFAECEWTTPPNVPTWELVIRVMDQHILAAHGVTSQQDQGLGRGSRQEKLPRPSLDTGITDADWAFFESQWRRYKRATRLEGQDAVDQLWACASEELGRQCHDAGVSVETTEENLLDTLRHLSIKAQNKLVNVVEFLDIAQESEEPVSKYISRVKGQAKVCEFNVTCPAEACGQEVSYSDKLCSHVIVRGLNDSEIQERVLALAATEENLTLKRITEFLYAQETGRESRKLLSGAGSLNKMSQFKKQQRERSNTLPSRPENHSQPCSYCGLTGHGQKSSAEVRRDKCPAFNKKCSKCGSTGHFGKMCKKKKRNEHGALQDRGSVSDTGDLDGFSFFSMTQPATKPRHKARNLRKLSHHAVDMFGKWVARKPEPQPSVTVTVSVSQKGYKEVNIPAPRKPRNVACSALPDTGAQMVVAGLDLVHKLGVTKKELFPVSSGIKAANDEGLKLIGGLLITVSAAGSDGITRAGSHMCYVSENVTRLFLSKEACRDLGIIGENFPEIGSSDTANSINKCELVSNTAKGEHLSSNPGAPLKPNSVNKCDLVDPDNPDTCRCPERAQTPEPPKQLPYPPTEENIPKLKKFIEDYYKESAFNCCEQQTLPRMKDSPPMRLELTAQ